MKIMILFLKNVQSLKSDINNFVRIIYKNYVLQYWYYNINISILQIIKK